MKLLSGPTTLKGYKKRIEGALKQSISKLGDRTKLVEACEYSLLTEGKRVRPILTLAVAESLDKGVDVTEAALAIEYFHTASLIADDMPCMDDDAYRRCKPALHKVYGETVALLATYALISAGYEKIYDAGMDMKKHFSHADRATCLAVKHASRCGGSQGATGGQFLDIYPPKQDLDTLKNTLYQKTVTPFEVAFIFGWIFGGGDLALLGEVSTLSYHFGMAFQIADDISDMEEDAAKNAQSNMALHIGKAEALELFEQEMHLFDQKLLSLNLSSEAFEEMKALIRKHLGSL